MIEVREGNKFIIFEATMRQKNLCCIILVSEGRRRKEKKTGTEKTKVVAHAPFRLMKASHERALTYLRC